MAKQLVTEDCCKVFTEKISFFNDTGPVTTVNILKDTIPVSMINKSEGTNILDKVVINKNTKNTKSNYSAVWVNRAL